MHLIILIVVFFVFLECQEDQEQRRENNMDPSAMEEARKLIAEGMRKLQVAK